MRTTVDRGGPARLVSVVCPRPIREVVRRPGIPIFFGLALAFLLSSIPTPVEAGFSLIESTEDRTTFLFDVDPSGTDQVGSSAFWDRAPDSDLGSVTWIAMPPGSNPEVQVEILEEVRPEWPPQFDPGRRESLQRSLPRSESTVGEPSWVRDIWGFQFTMTPLLGVGSNGLRLVTRARITVLHRYPDGDRIGSRVAGGDDPFEPVYRSGFLNYASTRTWRRVPRNTGGLLSRGGEPYFWDSSNPWIKVMVSREDLYGITGQELETIGIDLSQVDPLTLRLFSPLQLPLPENTSWDEVPQWMDEIPIRLEGVEDGILDPSDRLLFLGQGPDAWYSSKGLSPPGLEEHAYDPYANENVYWLTWGGSFPGEPRRMPEVEASTVETPFVRQVRDRLHLEENRIFDARPKDLTGIAAWEVYWWRSSRGTSAGNDTHRVTVTLPNAVSGDDVDVLARIWSANNVVSGVDPPATPPDHDLEFTLNGFSIGRRQWDGFLLQDYSGSDRWLVPGDTQIFRMIIHAHNDPTIERQDIINLAWIEVGYTRRLDAIDDRQEFFAGGFSGTQSFEMTGFTREDIVVLDASDANSPRWLIPQIEAEGELFTTRFRSSISEDPPARFLARPSGDLAAPRLERDQIPSGGYLRERNDAVQMIILTHPAFRAAAEDLAAYRRTHYPGRSVAEVAVVDVQEVYDEFSFGRTDPTAIRNFLQYARDAWTGGNPADGPAYLLLLGDAHYDYRGHVAQSPPNFVPTYVRYYFNPYQSQIYDPRFSSDDYFVLLDGPSDVGIDLFMGRMAAGTLFQAQTMVDKVLAYENNRTLDPWKNRVTLVADDICQSFRRDPLTWMHTRQTEALTRGPFLECFERDKIYMVEYGRECVFTDKPAAAADLMNSMNEGTLVVNYTGHGSESQLADERIFEISSVAGLNNRDRLFLFLTASCSVGKYDTSNESLGEAMVRHPDGGAIIVFSAASVATSAGNHELNRQFFLKMYEEGVGDPLSVGVSEVLAKLEITGNINPRRFLIHGDPAVVLVSPRDEVRLNLARVTDGAQLGDTLWRGVRTRLEGDLYDGNGLLMSDFDGDAVVRVFDSEVFRKADLPINDYFVNGVPLYRGTARVTGGHFSTEFQVPAALRTGEKGNAQIYVYAENGETDATGCLVDLIVPETSPPPSDDQDGPVITFVFEGESDVLSVEAPFTITLEDSSGINVTGLVASRSIVVRIDEAGETIHAEEVAGLATFGDDYQMATVSTALPPNLPEGRRYDLIVEASDNLNNRSESRVSFLLSGSTAGGFEVSRVFNFPNPADRESRFFGRINEEAEIEVKIFTLLGREISRLGPSRMTPRQFEETGVYWNGRDQDGDRPANGVYFYKVSATPVSGGKTKTVTARLVISR